MTRRMRVLSLATLAILLVACSSSPPPGAPTPEAAARTFMVAVAKGDLAAANTVSEVPLTAADLFRLRVRLMSARRPFSAIDADAGVGDDQGDSVALGVSGVKRADGSYGRGAMRVSLIADRRGGRWLIGGAAGSAGGTLGLKQ